MNLVEKITVQINERKREGESKTGKKSRLLVTKFRENYLVTHWGTYC